MSRTRRTAKALVDPAIAAVLFAAYVALLLSTVRDLGYARDEGFYIQAAKSYGRWFHLLASDAARAMQPAVIDRYWSVNHEHPALMKSLFALSYDLLHVKEKVFAESGTAFRFPGVLLSALAVSVTYLWGRNVHGRLAGLVGALLFAMIPRVFYHAHLDCFDMPVASLWLVTAYAYWRSVERGGIARAVVTGVLYGLLLDTKHNSWLFPAAVVGHVVLSRGTLLFRDLRRGRVAAPLSLLTMATIGPAVFYAGWPWIWRDTGARLADYVEFHVGHVYYNMEFLGRTYFEPPMPRGYAWLMTLGTVPAVTLLLFAIGLAAWLRRSYVRRGFSAGPARRGSAPELLWALSVLISYAPWWSSSTPIFGGTKHWLTAYPFLCLFAGTGFSRVVESIRVLVPEALRRFRLAEVGLVGSVLAAPAVMTLTSHPWGLSAYTPLVGGAPGAATLGLNRTFWGYTTGAVQRFLNRAAPRGATVFVHDTALQSWDVMVADGRLRRRLRGTLSIPGSQLALYHHEPHMGKVEYQIWVDYGTVRPAHVGTYDGVPVVWVYRRPGSFPHSNTEMITH